MIRLSSDEEKILAEEEDLYSDSYEQVSLTCTVTAMSRSVYSDSYEQVSLTCTVTAMRRPVSPVQ
jgi:hypothetical protein